jgi:hypothetical protein
VEKNARRKPRSTAQLVQDGNHNAMHDTHTSLQVSILCQLGELQLEVGSQHATRWPPPQNEFVFVLFCPPACECISGVVRHTTYAAAVR